MVEIRAELPSPVPFHLTAASSLAEASMAQLLTNIHLVIRFIIRYENKIENSTLIYRPHFNLMYVPITSSSGSYTEDYDKDWVF